jgi:hypothetical protein
VLPRQHPVDRGKDLFVGAGAGGVEHLDRIDVCARRNADDADGVVDRADDAEDVRAVFVVVVEVELLRERVVAARDVGGEIDVVSVDARVEDGDVHVLAARHRPDVARVNEIESRGNDLRRLQAGTGRNAPCRGCGVADGVNGDGAADIPDVGGTAKLHSFVVGEIGGEAVDRFELAHVAIGRRISSAERVEHGSA